MTDVPGGQLDEEPQAERGAPGSRDSGPDEPSEGPGRTSGTSDEQSDTSVDPQGSEGDAPHLPTP
jgi:hypothetical protein